MKSSFGTKRSQVQILSPRPLFSGFVKASPVFLCLIFGQTGHKRTFPFSDATGKQPTMVDLCTLLSAFGRPFGKKQTWADVSGNGRSEGDKNAQIYFALSNDCKYLSKASQFYQSRNKTVLKHTILYRE